MESCIATVSAYQKLLSCVNHECVRLMRDLHLSDIASTSFLYTELLLQLGNYYSDAIRQDSTEEDKANFKKYRLKSSA